MCLWIFFKVARSIEQMYLARPTEDLGMDYILVSITNGISPSRNLILPSKVDDQNLLFCHVFDGCIHHRVGRPADRAVMFIRPWEIDNCLKMHLIIPYMGVLLPATHTICQLDSASWPSCKNLIFCYTYLDLILGTKSSFLGSSCRYSYFLKLE